MRQRSLFLASASPRRRQILGTLGLPFQFGVSPIDEDAIQLDFNGTPDNFAQWTAEKKALGVFTLAEITDQVVITADTTVLLDDQMLNKPKDAAHAYTLLASLRDRWHRVVTGIVVSFRDQHGEIQMHTGSQTTPVLMRNYSDEEIYSYIATGDPLDKAGAYGIQHPHFQPTASIEGCYLNVVGMPLCLLVELLAKVDIQPISTGTASQACPWSERCRIKQ